MINVRLQPANFVVCIDDFGRHSANLKQEMTASRSRYISLIPLLAPPDWPNIVRRRFSWVGAGRRVPHSGAMSVVETQFVAGEISQ